MRTLLAACLLCAPLAPACSAASPASEESPAATTSPATTADTAGSATTAGDTTGGTTTGGTPTDTAGATSEAAMFTACSPTAPTASGIGKPCTANGGECTGVSAAPFCTGDYLKVDHPHCTRFCDPSLSCGAGATCVQDPKNAQVSLCMPSTCVTAGTTLTAPAALSGCLPNRGAGNTMSVGKACAAGSGSSQCGGPLSGRTCASDPAAAPVAFCSKLCLSDTECGDGATCVINPLGTSRTKGCFPTSCLP